MAESRIHHLHKTLDSAQKMALVPNSVSERDVQIDSLHLIHRALIYYKKASLLDD